MTRPESSVAKKRKVVSVNVLNDGRCRCGCCCHHGALISVIRFDGPPLKGFTVNFVNLDRAKGQANSGTGERAVRLRAKMIADVLGVPFIDETTEE